MNAIQDRYSVRAYTDQAVSRETLETVLRAAQQSPSGGNLQPWHVYVTAGQDKGAFVKKGQFATHS